MYIKIMVIRAGKCDEKYKNVSLLGMLWYKNVLGTAASVTLSAYENQTVE